MNSLQKLGLFTAFCTALLAVYGARAMFTDVTASVEVFEITKVWKTWNWILTGIQVLGIFFTIRILSILSSGRKWVFAEEKQPAPEVVELWKTGEDGWDEKETAVMTKEERDERKLQELSATYGGSGTPDFWKDMARQYKKSQYPKTSFYCVGQKRAAERRSKKIQVLLRKEGDPSPTVVLD